MVSHTQSLAEIAAYHNDATDSLSYFLRSQFANKSPRFLGYKKSEFDDLLVERRGETDLRSSLAILASVEAALRIDFSVRVKELREDPLSKAFQSFSKRQKGRARFEELLALWAEYYPELKPLVSELRASLKFRHWLAHGRYWERPNNSRFDYVSLYDLADATLRNFPLSD